MARFPYSILFLEKSGAILVVAIAHAKRETDYWKDRI
jgi:hypothetical protein